MLLFPDPADVKFLKANLFQRERPAAASYILSAELLKEELRALLQSGQQEEPSLALMGMSETRIRTSPSSGDSSEEAGEQLSSVQVLVVTSCSRVLATFL